MEDHKTEKLSDYLNEQEMEILNGSAGMPPEDWKSFIDSLAPKVPPDVVLAIHHAWIDSEVERLRLQGNRSQSLIQSMRQARARFKSNARFKHSRNISKLIN